MIILVKQLLRLYFGFGLQMKLFRFRGLAKNLFRCPLVFSEYRSSRTIALVPKLEAF